MSSRQRAPSVRSLAEESFALAFTDAARSAFGLDAAKAEPTREYQFDPTRGWRFDFAWPEHKIALEVEGRGRHQRVKGFRDDCEKYNAAASRGWRLLRFPAMDHKFSRSREQWPRGALSWAYDVIALMCAAEDANG